METNNLARVHKTRPTGEIFEDWATGMRVEVVEDEKRGKMSCEGCFYCGRFHHYCLGIVKEIGECTDTFRDENKNLHLYLFD